MLAATPAELGSELARATRGAPALLVLDGSSATSPMPARSRQLLPPCRTLTMLATSRAPLRLTAEHAYRVRPLAVPNAAALFIARVRASGRVGRRRDSEVVDEICARLDSLPLAIELAADRARLLPLPACWSGFSARLAMLTYGPRDLPERQRSLAPRSTGPGSCSNRRTARCSPSCACSRAARRWRPCQAVCRSEGQPVEVLLGGVVDRTR